VNALLNREPMKLSESGGGW